MAAEARAEGALRWFLRAAIRYILAFAVGWFVLAGALTLLVPHPGDEDSYGLVAAGYLLFPLFGGISLVILLALSPLRFFPHLRAFGGIALAAPLLLILVAGGAGWLLLALTIIQFGFVLKLMPEARFRVTTRRR
ncbi:hypothetical protein ACIPLC_38155 [Kitasatospora sp. NPDC086801]|uniref:hypothetical protein n=1 Tax=Kitasatospora sp. NPDC086801 TaxID=3364066 RepID=UPI00380E53D8